jgi:hypothetical protein
MVAVGYLRKGICTLTTLPYEEEVAWWGVYILADIKIAKWRELELTVS